MSDYLEYYNSNLLTRYPFVGSSNDNTVLPIANNWFGDIILYSFNPDIVAAYLSELTIDPVGGTVQLLFSDPVSNATIMGATFLISAIVDNTNPANISFLSAITDNTAIKVVFGPGFQTLLASNIDQYYTADESTLNSSSIIQCIPKVRSLTFLENYPYDTIEVYDDSNQNVDMQFGTNIVGNNEDGTLVMDVSAGSGAGYYNPCEDQFPTADLLSINFQVPNTAGNLFFIPSPCYSMKILDSTDIATYNATLTAQYDPFSIPSQTPDTFNALVPGYSFFFVNNCTPKCAPENLDAFATYVNRTYNGVQDLVYYADSPNQTTGTCSTSTSAGVTTLTASAFSSTYPSETGFIKYFHEGKNIFYQSGLGALSHTNQIAKVLSTTSVTLVTPLSPDITNNLFQVDDLGIFQKINAAITNYNTNIAPYVQAPNGAISSTNYSGTDEYGNAVTFIAIVCSVYNPTISSMTFTVPNPTLTGTISLVPGSQQTLYNGTTTAGQPTNFTVACKMYANYQVIYAIPCGVNTASVAFAITETWGSFTNHPLPGGTGTVSATSISCPPPVTSASTVNTYNGATFCYQIVASGANAVVFEASTLPSWATTNTSIPTSCNISGTVSETGAKTYTVEMVVETAGGGYTPFTLFINVEVTPVVSVTNQSMYVGVPYIYQIPATQSPTSYNATNLPAGLAVNTTTGAIYGVPTTVQTKTVTASATNLAGTGSANFTATVTQPAPVITSPLTDTATHGTPYAYQITATNNPTSFGATSLPSGLYVDTAVGLIYGVPASAATDSIGLSATNSGGTGTNTLVLTVS